jgi:DNA-directed RNA polymerase specialized sigma24 family protein
VTAQTAFDRYHRAIFNFVRRLTHSADTAEDITQERFLTYVRAPECQLESEASLIAGDPRPGIEASAAVERAVAALPMIEKEALILFQYEGMTLVEIGHIVGAEVGTVKGRLHRARERLRVALAQYRSVGECNGAE